MINDTTEERPNVFERLEWPAFKLHLVYSGEDVLVPPVVYTPGRGTTQIGRRVEGGISLPCDRRASRLHATLHREPSGTLRIVDEGSLNGTSVNGRRVTDARLADGDLLAIGDSYFVVRAVPPGVRDGMVPSMLGVSPAIRRIRAELAECGPTGDTVLLLAESGCGKEVAACALHELSRREGPLITVNCSAIPENLAESQFFGQIAGAFTSAAARPGFFRAAHGGTLFLDEIGDLPLAIQPKLLRVLEESAVIPLGATTPVPVDVRIIAATNRDLRTAITKQQFRGDLYARLAQLEVSLPPLRDRREDVLLLLRHALGEPARRLAPRLAEALLLYTWPFNVREVFSVAKELRVRSAGAELLDLLLVADRLRPVRAPTASPRTSRPPPLLKRPPSSPPATPPAPPLASPPAPGPIGDADDHEADGTEDDDDGGTALGREALEALLEAHHGVVIKAALAVGRSRRQVYRWIGRHGIDLNRFRGSAR